MALSHKKSFARNLLANPINKHRRLVFRFLTNSNHLFQSFKSNILKFIKIELFISFWCDKFSFVIKSCYKES